MARAAQLRPRNGAQAQSRMRWRIENAGERASVYLYDEIGFWGVTAGDFVRALQELNGAPIDLHVNSEGGDVFDGLAIYNALLNYPADVTAHVDALAASAASFIVQAANRRLIAGNASMMIHEAQGLAVGCAEDMRQLANLLDDSSQNIAEIYDVRCGGGADSWRAAMKATTWYRGQAAVDAGLCDEMMPMPKKMPTQDNRERRPAAHFIRDVAIAYSDHGKAPMDEAWSAPSLADFTDQQWGDLSDAEKRRIAAHFVWSDSGDPPAAFSDLGGPHHRASTSGVGPAVWRGCSSGRMQQASWADDAGVRDHLASHYRDFGMTPPWESQDNLGDIDLSLIPPAANGYKPPLPSDLTRLVAANLPAGK